MSTAITLEELLAWSDETTQKWFQFLAQNPQVLELPSGIFNTTNLLGLVRHIVAVEVRHGQRLAGEPVAEMAQIPDGPLEVLLELHTQAIARLKQLLADPAQDWLAEMEIVTLSAGTLRASRRKLFAHMQLHAIRHWAQAATLSRTAGFPAPIAGDLLASSALA
jgi:uncharacterized damage-inducible protein DinB